MNILNLLKRKPKEKAAELAAAEDPYAEIKGLRMFGGSRGLAAHHNVGFVSVLKDIRFPNILITNPFEQAGLNKAIEDLAKSLGGDHFDICPFHCLRDIYQFKPNSSQEASYRNLQHIHCVSYSKLSREVMAQIVPEINNYFSCFSTHPGYGAVAEKLKELPDGTDKKAA